MSADHDFRRFRFRVDSACGPDEAILNLAAAHTMAVGSPPDLLVIAVKRFIDFSAVVAMTRAYMIRLGADPEGVKELGFHVQHAARTYAEACAALERKEVDHG